MYTCVYIYMSIYVPMYCMDVSDQVMFLWQMQLAMRVTVARLPGRTRTGTFVVP